MILKRPLTLTAVAALATVAVAAAVGHSARPAQAAIVAGAVPNAKHVFVINLENKGYDESWGSASVAPYMSKTLRAKGNLLSQYYGIGHNSLDNYIAQISGQGPNPQTQADCQVFSDFTSATTVAPGQAVGTGCVYPAAVTTIADQLSAKGLSWKGYMQDMATPCRHPAVNSRDTTQSATVGDQYAARHNPFVYFHSIIDSPVCTANVVDLNALPRDLRSVATTPSLSYITPNLCNDGHDAPCVSGEVGGLATSDVWLRTWVPRILASPAFKADGVLILTFDESDSAQTDATACCGETAVNTPMPGITGPGGGRIGALVLSRFVKPGSTTATPYNHYSLLASMEDLFGLAHLGYAGSTGLVDFGDDVYTCPRSCTAPTSS